MIASPGAIVGDVASVYGVGVVVEVEGFVPPVGPWLVVEDVLVQEVTGGHEDVPLRHVLEDGECGVVMQAVTDKSPHFHTRVSFLSPVAVPSSSLRSVLVEKERRKEEPSASCIQEVSGQDAE